LVSLKICPLHYRLSQYQITKDEMAGACNTNERGHTHKNYCSQNMKVISLWETYTWCYPKVPEI
jgi:hypothetical protein